jgi:hypothetical protein
MAASFDVVRRSAKPTNEEVAQPLLRAGEVVGWIHRPEQVICRHLAVEGGDQTPESVLSDITEDLFVLQLARLFRVHQIGFDHQKIPAA